MSKRPASSAFTLTNDEEGTAAALLLACLSSASVQKEEEVAVAESAKDATVGAPGVTRILQYLQWV